jgi:hypothetical protein
MKRSVILAFVLVAGLMALPAQARFQVRCFSSHVAQVDPIVSPGGVSHHEHEFFGNRSTDANSTYASMIASTTNCSTKADTAAYWTPTVYKGDRLIKAKSLLIYYRGDRDGDEITHAFPIDLRIVSDDFHFGAAGAADKLRVTFPGCWDGVHLDSPDHRSHMAFGGADCPASHPVRVPAITEVFRYDEAVTGGRLSSGDFSTGHADFWNTWQQGELVALVGRCLNSSIDCGRIDG